MSSETATLCRLGASAIGLAPGPTTDAVIATIQGDGVLQYSVTKQERTAGWSLGSSALSFSSPVVYNTASSLYLAPIQQERNTAQQLLSWSADAPTGTLDRIADRISLPKPVHAIHPTVCSPSTNADSDSRPADSKSNSVASTSGQSESDHRGVFVVFADGTVALDSFYSNGKTGQSIGQEGRVEATSCHRGRLAVVTLAGGHSYVLAMYCVTDGVLKETGTALLAPPEQAFSLTSLSIRGQALSALWSDGTLQTFYLFPTGGGGGGNLGLRLQACRRLLGFEQEQPAQQQASAKLRNGKKQAATPGKRKSSALSNGCAQPRPVVVTAPGSLVAAVGWTGGNAAASNKLRLAVVDGMYGTARRVESTPASDLGGSSKATTLQALHLGSDLRQLAVLASGSIFLMGLEDPPPTLATLVGALSHTGNSGAAQAARAAFQPEEWSKLWPPGKQELRAHGKPAWLPGWNIAESLDPAELLQNAVPLDIRDERGAAAAANQDTEEEQEKREQHGRITDKASYATAAAAEQLVAHLTAVHKGKDATRAQLLPTELLACLYLRLAEKGYWEQLEAVSLRKKLRQMPSAPGLVPRLAEGGQHAILARLMLQSVDLSAEDLQQALRHLLSRCSPGATAWHCRLREAASKAVELAEAKGPTAAAALKEAADAVVVVQRFSVQEVTLHPLLAARMDDSLLLRALRGLTAQQATRVAAYLQKWLHNFAELSVTEDGRQLSSGAVLPPLGHVVQWLGRLIDAHLVGLAMSTRSAELAKALQNVVRRHMTDITRYQPLLGSIKHLRRNAPLPNSGATDLYQVELLDISIY